MQTKRNAGSAASNIDLSLGVVTGDPLRTPDIGARGVLFQNDDGSWRGFYSNGKGCERHKGTAT